MHRLNRRNIEEQIHEMWDAIDGLGDVEPSERDLAVRQAHQTEANLRALIDRQDRMDEAAPHMLALLEHFCPAGGIPAHVVQHMGPDAAVVYQHARAIIERIKL